MPVRLPPRPIPVVAAAASPVLAVPLVEQEQGEWCWAACLEMILRYYGDATAVQCVLADILHPGLGCCGAPKLCDVPCLLADITTLYGKTSLGATMHDPIVDFPDIANEIALGRPVLVFLDRGQEGHLVVVAYAWVDVGVSWVWINDPRGPEAGAVAFDELLADGAAVCWTDIEVR